MRAVVFFDLPMETEKDKKEYRKFRKYLVDNGFFMMQKSVYSKLFLTPASYFLLKNQIKKHLPPSGNIQIMQLTEKQYCGIEFLCGKNTSPVISSKDRAVVV